MANSDTFIDVSRDVPDRWNDLHLPLVLTTCHFPPNTVYALRLSGDFVKSDSELIPLKHVGANVVQDPFGVSFLNTKTTSSDLPTFLAILVLPSIGYTKAIRDEVVAEAIKTSKFC